ncbi:MAG: hypothetical protein AAFX06_09315 [Planctomycetota bacterium]
MSASKLSKYCFIAATVLSVILLVTTLVKSDSSRLAALAHLTIGLVVTGLFLRSPWFQRQ